MNDTMMTDEPRDLRSTAGLLLDSIICFEFHSADAHNHNHIGCSIPLLKVSPYTILANLRMYVEMSNYPCC